MTGVQTCALPILPLNILYMGAALLTWFALTPDLARMATWSWDWVAIIYGRNLAMTFLVYGGLHFRFYIRKSQGTRFMLNRREPTARHGHFLFRDQVLDNVFRTFASAVPVWTGYEVITLWGQANGWFPYVSWRDHPVYCGLFMLLIPLILDPPGEKLIEPSGGAFSDDILRHCPAVTLLWSVDRWSDHHGVMEYWYAADRLAMYGTRSRVRRCTFTEAAAMIPDGALDWCFIDGYAHTGQEAGATLEE